MKPDLDLDQDFDGVVERGAGEDLPFRGWTEGLRATWRREQARRRQRELVFVHTIGLVLCLLCLPLDYALGPEVFGAALILRLGVVVPVYLVAIFAARHGSWLLQRWTTILTVPCFATAAAYLGMHFAHDEMREYVMAAGLLITMATVVVPLRPANLALMVLLSLAGLWGVWATMPSPGGNEHVLIGFLSVVSIVTLAIPIRTARLKDQNFLFALRSRMVSERLLLANEQLRELSHRDDLTGLPNRRYFERIFDTAFRTSVDSGGDLAAMMIDVDRFKAFNDTHGHVAGDRALKQVATELEKHFAGPGQTVARYGGEEFVVVVERCDEGQALRLADAARRAVAGRPVSVAGGGRVPITVSIGVTTCKPGDAAPSDLIERADGALYDAKQAGRDLVRLARDGGRRSPPELLRKSA